jgi:hypothetical protein
MTPAKTTKALQKLNLVLEDMQMLRDGTWVPDKSSCENTIDNITDVIYTLENEWLLNLEDIKLLFSIRSKRKILLTLNVKNVEVRAIMIFKCCICCKILYNRETSNISSSRNTKRSTSMYIISYI